MREAVGLEGIDVTTAGDDILPTGAPAPFTGNDMVEGEVRGLAALAGILAGIIVADKDVLPVELDLGDGQAIEAAQQEHLGNEDVQADGVDEIASGSGLDFLRVGDPFPGIHGGKLAVAGVDDARMILAEHAESPAHADNVDRLPVAVQDQHPVAGNGGQEVRLAVFIKHGKRFGLAAQGALTPTGGNAKAPQPAERTGLWHTCNGTHPDVFHFHIVLPESRPEDISE